MIVRSTGMAVAAAGAFSLGGLLMRPSDGLRRVLPTLLLFALFTFGAGSMTLVVRRGADVGVAYLSVLGLEAVLTYALSAAVFGEAITARRVVAVVLVIGGTVLLAASSP